MTYDGRPVCLRLSAGVPCPPGGCPNAHCRGAAFLASLPTGTVVEVREVREHPLPDGVHVLEVKRETE